MGCLPPSRCVQFLMHVDGGSGVSREHDMGEDPALDGSPNDRSRGLAATHRQPNCVPPPVPLTRSRNARPSISVPCFSTQGGDSGGRSPPHPVLLGTPRRGVIDVERVHSAWCRMGDVLVRCEEDPPSSAACWQLQPLLQCPPTLTSRSSSPAQSRTSSPSAPPRFGAEGLSSCRLPCVPPILPVCQLDLGAWLGHRRQCACE